MADLRQCSCLCTKVIFITWREKLNRRRYGDAVIDPAKAVAIPPMERC
jgi:hypothetical protein